MLVTETLAKAKWCPASRVMSKDGLGGGNRWNDTKPEVVPSNAQCLGRFCMAWREAPRPRETRRLYHDTTEYEAWGGAYRGKTDAEGWTYAHTDTDASGRRFDLLHRLPPDGLPPVGYCGLAGIPAEATENRNDG